MSLGGGMEIKMKGVNKVVIFNYILIIIFFVMIILPLIFFNHIEGKLSVIENKTLALKPVMIKPDGNFNEEFIAEYEKYFDDNIGWKQEALIANMILKYKCFGVVDIPNWMLGENGNLFYTSAGEDIKTYSGMNAYSEEQMKDMLECLQFMNQYFRQEGAYTYNVFIPNKEAIYSEEYNPYIYHEENSRQDIFSQYIKDNSDLNVINLKEDLLRNKSDNLYFKVYDGSHWNMNGAFIGYQELMNLIKKDIPDIKILNKEDFDITEIKKRGLFIHTSDIKILNDNLNFDDTGYSYDLREGYHSEIKSTGEEMGIDPNLNFFHYYNDTAKEGTLFIVGDSYMYGFLLPIIAESFENVYFIRNADAETIIELSTKINPDVFVLEVVERVFHEEFFTQYMSEYKNHLNMKMDFGKYKEIEGTPEIHIDYPQMENDIININKGDSKEIAGWIYDTVNNAPPKEIIMEIGGLYRQAESCYREDLAVADENKGNCGFRFVMDTKLLDNINEIKIYVITENDEIYQPYKLSLINSY